MLVTPGRMLVKDSDVARPYSGDPFRGHPFVLLRERNQTAKVLSCQRSSQNARR